MSIGDAGKINFVIRTRNEEQYIGFALQSVFDIFGSDVKVIIVDNQSTDDTIKNINLFPKRFYNIEIVSLPLQEYTPGKALNLGISKCTSGLIGILSAHCQITQFFWSDLLNHFINHRCFGVLGKQVPIKCGKRISPRYIWENFQHETVETNLIENVPDKRHFFHNAFSFIIKDIWEKVPFDEDLSGKEDRYWADKLVAQGYHFKFDPSLVCNHFFTKNGATWSD